MAEPKDKSIKLRGRENFLSWLILYEGIASVEDWFEINERSLEEIECNDWFQDRTLKIIGTTDGARKTNEKKAKKWLLEHLNENVLLTIVVKDSLVDILKSLNKTYGYSNVDPVNIKRDIRRVCNFHPSKDPSFVFLAVNKLMLELNSAGGSMDDSQLLECYHDGMSGDPAKDVFWFNCRGEMNMKRLSSFTQDTAEEYIQKFWNAHKIKSSENSYYVNENQELSRKSEDDKKKKWNCDYCATHRPSNQFTHDTKRCFLKRKESANTATEKMVNCGNKQNENCLFTNNQIYYDTGSSKTMITVSPKIDVKPTNTKVFTAGSLQPPHKAASIGTVQVGDMTVSALHMPTFSKSLLSGVQLAREQGIRQVIEPFTAKLEMSKNGKVVATGSYDPQSKLIKMDQDIVSEFEEIKSNQSALAAVQKDDWITVHRKLGHCNDKKMTETLKVSKGIELKNQFSPITCEDCLTGKMRSKNIPKKSTREYELLELIESDVQGPFDIVGVDGTNMNVKFVDARSGFVHMSTILNKEANTILDKFIPFQKRLENASNKKVKIFRCDGGTEFQGNLLSHLESSGIIQQRGTRYKKHHPPRAERMNQTILRTARASLKASKLPLKYYCEAQKFQVYVHNRLVNSTTGKTPFESIYGRKPDLSNLKPFGEICFAYVPKEIKNSPKLGDTGIRCRLIGYGDDFDTVEQKGWKLLVEEDEKMIFTDDVRFMPDIEIKKLPNYGDEELDDEIDYLFLDPDFIDDDDESNHPELLDETDDEEISNLLTEDQEFSFGDFCLLNEDLIKETWWKDEKYSESTNFVHSLIAVIDGIDVDYNEAISGNEKEEWLKAMQFEMNNIKSNNTYQLKKMPDGYKAIGCRWVLKKKLKKDGTLDKYKARLVAKGFHQRLGKDYLETFSPVAKFKSIRTIFAMAAINNWEIFHDDATSAFLNGIIKEALFMDQPQGFVSKSSPQKKWRLLKALYGLKQAPREWNSVLHDHLISEGFGQSRADPCIYFKRNDNQLTVIGVYVDDIISTGSQYSNLQEFRSKLKGRFKCSEGGTLDWCLGMEIENGEKSLFIHQKQYISQKLEEFSKHLDKNTKRTSPLEPEFQNQLESACGKMELTGYCDASWANLEDYRSISGNAFKIGNCLVSWSSKKQQSVSLSSTESEYISATSAAQECLWFKHLLEEIGYPQGCVKIYEDNQGCIALTKNPQDVKRTRHIQLRYHFIRDLVKAKSMEFPYIQTKLQLADIFTKGLPGNQLQKLATALGVCSKGGT